MSDDQEATEERHTLFPTAGPTEVEAMEEASSSQAPIKGFVIPKRKNMTRAVQGRKIMLEVDHLGLNLTKKTDIIHYDVKILPESCDDAGDNKIPKRLTMPVISTFLKQNFPNRYPAFDGVKNLYSSGHLIQTTSMSAKVKIDEEFCTKPACFEVTIQYAATINMNDLFRSFFGVGRSFFTRPTGEAINLGGGLELWYGHFQSAVLGWKPFINIDVAHKGFSKEQNIADFIKEIDYQGFQSNDTLPNYTLATLKSLLKNLKVAYAIPGKPSSKRYYNVLDIGDPPSILTFQKQGKKITIFDYYKSVKQYKLKYPHLPSLVIKAKEKNIYFPCELCTVVGGLNVIRKMDGNQTAALISSAATAAEIRKRKIQEVIQESAYNTDPVIKEFGLSVSGSFEKVEGHVLIPPLLQYGGSKTLEPRFNFSILNSSLEDHTKISVKTRKLLKCLGNAYLTYLGNGSWFVKDFKEPKGISKWAIIGTDYRNSNAIDFFIKNLQKCAKDLNMTIANPVIEMIPKRALEETLTKFSKKKFEIVMVIVGPNKDDYAKVKKLAELRLGILTQCIKSVTVERMNKSTGLMLLQKMNAKLNGLNHSLSLQRRPACLSKPCMIVGAGVTHLAPGQDLIPSIAVVAASYEENAFKYNITLRLQPPQLEVICNLAEMMIEHLEYFKNLNSGKLPEKIIMFREGVSDGQFQHVLNEELTKIRAACSKMEKNYRPPITMIIVQKRHHTRFFPIDKNDMDKNKNAPPGTCVDSKITHPTELDFFLLSHSSVNGTARPTRYHLIWDDSNMSENEIEHLTYYMCHLYGKCARSVSYPIPTCYAHRAATRASVLSSGIKFDLNDLERCQEAIKVKREIINNSPMFFI